MIRRVVVGRLAIPVLALVALVACRDSSRFSSRGDRFQGPIVKGSFVRSGLPETIEMCLTLDTDHLQDTPGTLSTSDGRFKAAPLRPIPQVWHDPISTLSFGDGRVQNLVYAAAPDDAQDVFVIVSLMQSDGIEVRLMRGAPGADAGATPALFGVFTLERQTGPCAF